ncbi:hypothetical protein SLS55_002596 [Diplodia seriata]|uniref:Uncharacterized protein n=1 Tax=Diplodia seriata TaxID=420778 RepID=A0ABR3CSN9_9PEZI
MQAQTMGLNQNFSHLGDCAFARNKSNAASDHSSSTFTFYAAAPSAPLNFSHHAHATRNDTSICPLLSSTDAHDDNDGAGIRLKKKRKRTDNDAGTAGTGEEVEQDGVRWSEDDAEQPKGKVEEEKKEEKGQREGEENESAYFDSLIFGIAATAVVAADSPALSNTSVFVSDYDRLDDLAGDSSVLSSPARASSPSATTVATALTALTDEDDAATGLTADRYSSGSPSSMLFFDQLLETIPSDGEDAIVPPPVLQPPLLPLEQTQPSVSKRPPRPKGWNPNFASAPPPPPSSSEPLESSE